jgi:hypothetical protein
MIALLILLPAVLGVGLSMLWRARLKAASLTVWMGWLLIGAGVPVLAGQLVSLSLTGLAESRVEACEAAGGTACAEASLILVWPLVAGLSGALGWIAGAIAARLSGPSTKV